MYRNGWVCTVFNEWVRLEDISMFRSGEEGVQFWVYNEDGCYFCYVPEDLGKTENAREIMAEESHMYLAKMIASFSEKVSR